MKRIIPILVVVGIWLISKLPLSSPLTSVSMDNATALIALGFTVLAGHLVGSWLKLYGLPQVTGYMLVGILAGPHIAGVISVQNVQRLSFINNIALVLIALTAGGELRLPDLKKQWKAILGILITQTATVIILSALVIILAGHFFLPVGGMALYKLLVVGLIFGVVMSANSPSVAIAVISEMKARGPLTNLIMAVTVPKDVVVIVLFSIFMSLAYRFSADAPDHSESLALILLMSLVIGALFGIFLILYLKYIGRQVELAVLFLAVALVKVAGLSGLELLFTAVTMGFVVENFSQQGKLFLDGLEEISAPIFVVFFALAGASINLPMMKSILPVAILWCLLRTGSLWLGTKAGLILTRSTNPALRNAWLGYLPQAGVAMGLSAMIATEFPDFGAEFNTLVLAIIAINQVLGPAGLRYALITSGEAKN